MRIKRLIIAILATVSLFTLTGCNLAREDAGEAVDKDKLVGVFVTTEYLDLFDVEGYLNNNINSISGGKLQINQSSEKYQGRLYAVLKDKTLTNEETGKQVVTQEYVFEAVDGITYFTAKVPATTDSESFLTSSSDEAISDGHKGLSYSDIEDKTTLKGTIYVSPNRTNSTYYINPVYQSSQGSVYAMSGNGISVGGIQDEGIIINHKLDESTTVTENGKIKKVSISVELSIAIMLPPERIAILQMDRDSAVLSRREYTPGAVPQVITPEAGATYIIVETYKKDSQGAAIVSRELFSEKDEALSTYFCRKDGISIKEVTQLSWRKSASISLDSKF